MNNCQGAVKAIPRKWEFSSTPTRIRGTANDANQSPSVAEIRLESSRFMIVAVWHSLVKNSRFLQDRPFSDFGVVVLCKPVCFVVQVFY